MITLIAAFLRMLDIIFLFDQTDIILLKQAVCQQILILSKGHLAAAGSLEELTADGKSLEEVFLELTDGESEEATGEEDAE